LLVLTGLEVPHHSDLAKAACLRSPVLKLLATADQVEAACPRYGRLPMCQALARIREEVAREGGREMR
jgi:hypothetical protein